MDGSRDFLTVAFGEAEVSPEVADLLFGITLGRYQLLTSFSATLVSSSSVGWGGLIALKSRNVGSIVSVPSSEEDTTDPRLLQ